MKKVKIIILLTLMLSIFGCSDKFLEQKDLYRISNESYFKNDKEIGEALTGIYSVLAVEKGHTFPVLIANVLSDEMLGGGDGSGDGWIIPVDKFEKNAQQDCFEPLWRRYYQGIFRANSIIESFDQATYANENQRNQDLGEVYFLRSYMYFQLACFFGTVPLITTTLSGNEPRADVHALFAQIASDMKKAADLMPNTSFSKLDPQKDGHATKWAAESMIGRIWLFYTGTYAKTELPLVGGGSITKSDAIAYIEDVMKNSEHRLISNFPELWCYTATGQKKETWLVTSTIPSSPKTMAQSNPYKDAGRDGTGTTPYEWIGDSGSPNPESVFTLKFNTFGAEAIASLPRSNHMVLYNGIRGGTGVPHGVGWGFCTVHPKIWNDFEKGDIRKYGSMFNVEDPISASLEGTTAIKFQDSKSTYNGFQVTGIFNKKYMPVQVQVESKNPALFQNLWESRGYTFSSSQHANMQDLMLIRFADVLLMHSELTGNADGMNQVRRRAGLNDVTYSFDALKAERFHELAFEGLRYFDLIRWGDCKKAFDALGTVKVADGAFAADGSYPNEYAVTEWTEDKKFIQIPESQIRLSAGVLTQNKGWE
jgi:hypothetical protein